MEEFDKKTFWFWIILLTVFYPIYFTLVALGETTVNVMIFLITWYMPLVILWSMFIGNELGKYWRRND
jgi:hypothetical protein